MRSLPTPSADAIKVYNKSRAARRAFVKLANDHCDVITPTRRSAVLKAFYFMEKPAYTEMLEELNKELEALPVCDWKGTKVVTSGIICDNPKLLAAFEENNVAIAADDVAHESRSFNTDVPEDEECPMMALAKQFANIDHDVLLYDPQLRRTAAASSLPILLRRAVPRALYCSCSSSVIRRRWSIRT